MEGTRNMPAPMIVPTTSDDASQRLSCRRRCVERVMPSMGYFRARSGRTEVIINDRRLGDLSSPTRSYMESSGRYRSTPWMRRSHWKMPYPTRTFRLLLLAACASTAIIGCPDVPQWSDKDQTALLQRLTVIFRGCPHGQRLRGEEAARPLGFQEYIIGSGSIDIPHTVHSVLSFRPLTPNRRLLARRSVVRTGRRPPRIREALVPLRGVGQSRRRSEGPRAART